MRHVYTCTCTQWYRCGNNMIPLHSLVMGQYLAGNGLEPPRTGAPRICTWRLTKFKIWRSVERSIFSACTLDLKTAFAVCFYALGAPVNFLLATTSLHVRSILLTIPTISCNPALQCCCCELSLYTASPHIRLVYFTATRKFAVSLYAWFTSYLHLYCLLLWARLYL